MNVNHSLVLVVAGVVNRQCVLQIMGSCNMRIYVSSVFESKIDHSLFLISSCFRILTSRRARRPEPMGKGRVGGSNRSEIYMRGLHAQGLGGLLLLLLLLLLLQLPLLRLLRLLLLLLLVLLLLLLLLNADHGRRRQGAQHTWIKVKSNTAKQELQRKREQPIPPLKRKSEAEGGSRQGL